MFRLQFIRARLGDEIGRVEQAFKCPRVAPPACERSEEHTSELQSQSNLVCRLLLGKKRVRISWFCVGISCVFQATPPRKGGSQTGVIVGLSTSSPLRSHGS